MLDHQLEKLPDDKEFTETCLESELAAKERRKIAEENNSWAKWKAADKNVPCKVPTAHGGRVSFKWDLIRLFRNYFASTAKHIANLLFHSFKRLLSDSQTHYIPLYWSPMLAWKRKAHLINFNLNQKQFPEDANVYRTNEKNNFVNKEWGERKEEDSHRDKVEREKKSIFMYRKPFSSRERSFLYSSHWFRYVLMALHHIKWIFVNFNFKLLSLHVSTTSEHFSSSPRECFMIFYSVLQICANFYSALARFLWDAIVSNQWR